ncbi:MAG: alpha/beta fold hydrolase [Rhodothermales bacterium]
MNLTLFSQSYGTGTPLIILHGLLGASGNWHTLSRNVFAEEYNVFTLDLRNHGRSPHADAFDYGVMVEDVRQFIEDNELETAHVLGHSMGGKVAMWLALKYPALVSKLIVADMAPRAYPPHHMHILNALKNLDLPVYSSRGAIEEALAVDIKETGVRQFLLKNLSASGSGTYTWKMNLLAIYNNYRRINEGIDADLSYAGPALFVKGGRSNYITEKDTPQIQSLFPQATIEEIPNIGHWVHAEAPKQFAEMVMAFLGS